MLDAALKWREDFNVKEIMHDPEELARLRKENATGKGYMRGVDKLGRPVMVLRPAVENTWDYTGNMKHLTYNMERARIMLQERTEGKGKLCILIDFTGYAISNAPPMKTSKQTLKILQAYYPETLGRCFLISPPWLFSKFFSVISPFIDKVTREKVVFVTDMEDHEDVLNLEEVEAALGGKHPAPFSSELYMNGPLNHCFNQIHRAASPEGSRAGQCALTGDATAADMPGAL
ncbi:unnamed protein product [Chrysoparadoxa australica]